MTKVIYIYIYIICPIKGANYTHTYIFSPKPAPGKRGLQEMTMEFFMKMIPPTATAQEHKVMVRNGRPFFYDPPKVKQAKQKLMAELARHVPEKPLEGKPLRLVTKWIFPKRNQPQGATEWLTKKPDTDNLQKMLKDCMTRLGFWKDDCLVCSEICEKFSGTPSGIFISVQELSLMRSDSDDTEGD